jgi:hypothetical protein
MNAGSLPIADKQSKKDIYEKQDFVPRLAFSKSRVLLEKKMLEDTFGEKYRDHKIRVRF